MSHAELNIPSIHDRVAVRHARPVLGECVAGAARTLDLATAHAEAVLELSLLHRDPFDRLLTAQALNDGMVLVSADDRLLSYPLSTIDARR
ncbi:MAG: PIN domain-containing protein [Microthrixaceae bacterium]